MMGSCLTQPDKPSGAGATGEAGKGSGAASTSATGSGAHSGSHPPPINVGTVDTSNGSNRLNSPSQGKPGLTESALQQLEQTPPRRGASCSPRPSDMHQDLPKIDEAAGDAFSGSQEQDESAPHGPVPDSTPPPVPPDLPEVSLQDIQVMEAKQGKRNRRVHSRRASTTTSLASLTAIPENVEITPLHARSERSDSVRYSKTQQQPMQGKLPDVHELGVDTGSSHFYSSTRSGAESAGPDSVLSAGDDSIMPGHVVETEYETHIPLLPHPVCYQRYRNATEAARKSMSSFGGGVDRSLERSAERSGTSPVPSPRLEYSNRFDLEKSHDGATSQQLEMFWTDDSGLQLLKSEVERDDGVQVLTAEQLQLKLPGAEGETEEVEKKGTMRQGLMQQETVTFRLPTDVEGLRCVKKYTVGEINWDQTVLMGDFKAGEHSFQFEESAVPSGLLLQGDYHMKTIFMDGHGQYLWAGVNDFKVVSTRDTASHFSRTTAS